MSSYLPSMTGAATHLCDSAKSAMNSVFSSGIPSASSVAAVSAYTGATFGTCLGAAYMYARLRHRDVPIDTPEAEANFCRERVLLREGRTEESKLTENQRSLLEFPETLPCYRAATPVLWGLQKAHGFVRATAGSGDSHLHKISETYVSRQLEATRLAELAEKEDKDNVETSQSPSGYQGRTTGAPAEVGDSQM